MLVKYYLPEQTRVEDFDTESNVAFSNIVTMKYREDKPPCPAGIVMYDRSQVVIDESG